ASPSKNNMIIFFIVFSLMVVNLHQLHYNPNSSKATNRDTRCTGQPEKTTRPRMPRWQYYCEANIQASS
ncbi:MAG TPA: hypothetical protein VFQ97_05900, partial [Gallionella sp.]|nr:hypothetical protein [Gallionella sp.]